MNDVSVPLRDALTGAFSRAAFAARLGEEVERSTRYETNLALVVCDIDYFKSVNDGFGHARGDRVLVELVERLVRSLRASDSLFRYGGDEFVILLPNTSQQEAAVLGARLLQLARDVPFDGDPPLNLTLSLGIAAFPADGRTPEALFERADARSYQAKRRGRAQLIADDRPTPHPVMVTPSRLLERETALQAVLHFFEQLPAARRGIITFVGRSGAGHTQMLLETGQIATLHGYGVLALRGPAEGALPRALAELDSTRTEQFRAALATGSLDIELAEWVRGNDKQGLMVTLDGLDDANLAMLEPVFNLLKSPALPAAGLAYSGTLELGTLLDQEPGLHETILLSGLSHAATRVWLRTVLQWDAPEDFLEWFVQETRGLPRRIERGLLFLLDENYLAQTPHGWVVKPETGVLPLAEKIGYSRKPMPHNLPVATLSFIGREHELVRLRQMMMRGRLVTLTGVGGGGKTRLMLRLAGQFLSGSPDLYDGIFFVELAPLNDARLVVQAIADVLAVREHRQLSLLEAVQRDLRDKRMLILLDNCEHVLSAVAEFVAVVLRSCPRVKFLASSREALRVEGEQTLLVPSLSLPALNLPLALDELGDYEAIRLFVERAELANPAFRMTEANMSAVVQVCRRLDGIPLALELAAAKIKSMSVRQIAERLDDRFRLLTGGSRTALPRQQTLQALIDWSWQLLDEPERVLLRRLAVFANGWTLEAAESMYSAVEAVPPADVLSRLIDKSLVLAQEQDGVMRYTMLDTIRQYAREKLYAEEDALVPRTRHLEYFAKMAAQAEMNLRGEQQAVWIRRLETEHDNLRVALEWAFDRGAHDSAVLVRGVQMANALWWFWFLRSHYSEGLNWLAPVRAENPNIAPADRARAISRSAYFAYFGKYALAEAGALAQQAVVLCEQVEEREGLALASGILGIFYHNRGDLPESWAAFERALQLMRELKNYWGTAFISELVGWFALHEGDYEAASQYAQECLELRGILRIPFGLMTIQSLVGSVALLRGEYAAAAHAFETGLSMAQRMHIRINIANTKRNLANLALAQGQYDHAEPLFHEAITALNEPDGRDNRADVFFGLARIALARGELGQAQMLLEQALAMLVPDALQMDRFYARLEWANVQRLLNVGSLARQGYREALDLLDRTPWNKRGVILCALGIAAFARSERRLELAVELLAGAEILRTEIGMAWQVDERTLFQTTLDAVRGQLDADAFVRAWGSGTRLAPDSLRELMRRGVGTLPDS